jgi:hypothetical protein
VIQAAPRLPISGRSRRRRWGKRRSGSSRVSRRVPRVLGHHLVSGPVSSFGLLRNSISGFCLRPPLLCSQNRLLARGNLLQELGEPAGCGDSRFVIAHVCMYRERHRGCSWWLDGDTRTSDWGRARTRLPAVRVLVRPRLEEDASIADPVP